MAGNASWLEEVAELNHRTMNEAIQFDNHTQLERSRKLGNFFKPLVICCRFHRTQLEAQKKENKNF